MGLGLAILLGIIQGLTEFLPVSSSGHLVLFGTWFGLAESDLTFEILVHLATLLAILVYFREDWRQLWGLLRGRGAGELPRLVILHLIIATLPAVIVGLLFHEHLAWFHGRPAWIGACLLVTGTILLAGLLIRREGLPLDRLSWLVALTMGMAQAVAILPGISRAGITIMTALFLGMQREAAARFSFLMAVPVIGGAGLLAVLDLASRAQAISSQTMLAYGAGFAAAALSGFFALTFVMFLLRGRRFFYFGLYCLTLGMAAILLG